MFFAKVLADSVNPSDSRITTVELTYPRCIHSEFMTHRMFARNAASSRAIPVKAMLDRVVYNPFIPIHWGANQKGMQARQELTKANQDACEAEWLSARDRAVDTVRKLIDLNLHKQIANRLLEPWMWITVIATGNQAGFENFFKLRCHEDAEPHIQKVAYLLREEYDRSDAKSLSWGEDHLPLTGYPGDTSLSPNELRKVSTARCARVSYLTHDGRRDVSADIVLHDRLSGAGHWSPFEHVATASPDGDGGNLGKGWQQYRKNFVGEVCTAAPR